MSTSTWFPEKSAIAAELGRFISEKVAQVRAERRAPEHEMGPLSQAFFTAAEKGDWRGVFDRLAAFRDCAREGLKAGAESKPQVVYPVEWAVVNEVPQVAVPGLPERVVIAREGCLPKGDFLKSRLKWRLALPANCRANKVLSHGRGPEGPRLRRASELLLTQNNFLRKNVKSTNDHD
jgi:hypothetical protein